MGSTHLTFPIKGLAWVSECQKIVKHIDLNGRIIPVYETNYGKIEGLPEPQEDVYLIVSKEIAQLAMERTDLLYFEDHEFPELLSFAIKNEDKEMISIAIAKDKLYEISKVLYDAYNELDWTLEKDHEIVELIDALDKIHTEIHHLLEQ